MAIYNLAVYLVFITLFNFISSSVKTIYSFIDLGSSNVFSKFLMISLFSMAGVPPFLGFFSKVFIFVLVSNSNFYVLFPFLFILLFVGLYFYVQNIRFLNSTATPNFTPIVEGSQRVSPMFYYTSTLISFFLIFGLFFTEDLLILMS